MSLENNIKIKRLYQIVPKNVAIPSSWLSDNGYSSQLLFKYVKSGWIRKIARGLYVVDGTHISWQNIILGLQHFSGKKFYIGGMSALNLQGYAHYIPMQEKSIYIFSKEKPPSWVKSIKLEQKLVFAKKPFFDDLGLQKLPTHIDGFELEVSSPERAIFELLYLVKPDGLEFSFVAEIFESLTTLSPALLNKLLRKCKNMRVKRVFLFLSSYFNYSWFKHLDIKNVDLGVGKMQIVKDGVYDKKFLITVPREYNV